MVEWIRRTRDVRLTQGFQGGLLLAHQLVRTEGDRWQDTGTRAGYEGCASSQLLLAVHTSVCAHVYICTSLHTHVHTLTHKGYAHTWCTPGT